MQSKLRLKMDKYRYLAVFIIIMVLLQSNVVLAEDVSGDADAKWNAIIDFLLPWVSRLGGAITLIGGIEFGVAFKTEDAEGKTKGMRTIIAGIIVIAVGLSSDTFLV